MVHGFNIADIRAARIPLFKLFAHEFGHVLGLNHDCSVDGDAHMCNSSYGRHVQSTDDSNAIISQEGTSPKQIKTQAGTRSGGTINFIGSIQSLVPTAMWRPAIAGNGGASPSWDYAVAYVASNNEIKVATANDDASDNLTLGTIRNTGYFTRESPNIAVGASNRIAISWTDTTTVARTVNVAVSADGGQTWTRTQLSGWGSLGGVGVTYDWWANRWVLTWLFRGCSESLECAQGEFPKSHRVTTLVSNDSNGTTWSNSKITYGDSVTSPKLTPALTCARSDINRCLLVYRTLSISNIRTIRQQAFQLDTGTTYLESVSTSVETGNYGYSDISVARIGAAYIFTYVWPTMANDKMAYRIKTDAEGEAGAFSYALQTYATALSRTGFAVAYNYRTGRVRFLWKEE